MDDDQNRALMEYLASTLTKRQLVMNLETVEQFTPTFHNPKDKLKVSSMMTASEQHELCLRLFSHMLK